MKHDHHPRDLDRPPLAYGVAGDGGLGYLYPINSQPPAAVTRDDAIPAWLHSPLPPAPGNHCEPYHPRPSLIGRIVQLTRGAGHPKPEAPTTQPWANPTRTHSVSPPSPPPKTPPLGSPALILQALINAYIQATIYANDDIPVTFNLHREDVREMCILVSAAIDARDAARGLLARSGASDIAEQDKNLIPKSVSVDLQGEFARNNVAAHDPVTELREICHLLSTKFGGKNGRGS